MQKNGLKYLWWLSLVVPSNWFCIPSSWLSFDVLYNDVEETVAFHDFTK